MALTVEQLAARAAYLVKYRAAHKEKCKLYVKKYRQKDKAAATARCELWRKNNLPQVRARQKAWRAAHKDKTAEYTRRYHKRAVGKREAICAARRARILSATPVWADAAKMEALYRYAKQLAKITGTKWHVDHEVPLASKTVCGLHCEDNLQIIPASANRRKNNRYWTNMPESF